MSDTKLNLRNRATERAERTESREKAHRILQYLLDELEGTFLAIEQDAERVRDGGVVQAMGRIRDAILVSCDTFKQEDR